MRSNPTAVGEDAFGAFSLSQTPIAFTRSPLEKTPGLRSRRALPSPPRWDGRPGSRQSHQDRLSVFFGAAGALAAMTVAWATTRATERSQPRSRSDATVSSADEKNFFGSTMLFLAFSTPPNHGSAQIKSTLV